MEQDDLRLELETIEIEGGRKLYRYSFSGGSSSRSRGEDLGSTDQSASPGMAERTADEGSEESD